MFSLVLCHADSHLTFNTFAFFLGIASLAIVALYPFAKARYRLAAIRSGSCLFLGCVDGVGGGVWLAFCRPAPSLRRVHPLGDRL